MLPSELPLEIAETDEYMKQAELIAGSVRRWDEVHEATTWAIARKPQEFPLAVPDRGIRVVKTLALGDVPEVRIFFTANEHVVTLLWAEVVEGYNATLPGL